MTAIRSANLKATLQKCYLFKCSMKDKSSLKLKPAEAASNGKLCICFYLFSEVKVKKNSSNKNTKFSSSVWRLNLENLTPSLSSKVAFCTKPLYPPVYPREKVVFSWGMKMPACHTLKRRRYYSFSSNHQCYCFMVHLSLLSGFYEYRQ